MAALVLSETLGLHEVSVSALQLLIGLYAGFEGRNWQRAALRRRGYVLADVVIAESDVGAQQRFYDRHQRLVDAALQTA